jgi:hypothetical protein
MYSCIGSNRLELTYNQLTQNPEETASLLCNFLGVDNHPLPVPPHVRAPQSSGRPLDAICPTQNEKLGFAFRHTTTSRFLPENSSPLRSTPTKSLQISNDSSMMWNIILPICSKGATSVEAFNRLKAFDSSIRNTTTNAEWSGLQFTIGIDHGDAVFENKSTKARIIRLLPKTIFVMFESEFAGNTM